MDEQRQWRTMASDVITIIDGAEVKGADAESVVICKQMLRDLVAGRVLVVPASEADTPLTPVEGGLAKGSD